MPPVVHILDSFAAPQPQPGVHGRPDIAMNSDGDRTPCQAVQPVVYWGAERMRPTGPRPHPGDKTP
jgi:hypothetical protein